MLKERSEVASGDCWNLALLYPSLEEWQKDYEKISAQGHPPYWPELAAYKGRLGESAQTLRKALELFFSIDRHLAKLYAYAHLRHDEEITDDQNKVAYNKIITLLHAYNQEACWLEPELLEISQDTLNELIHSEILEDYQFHLKKIVRLKAHTLSADKEILLAYAGKAMHIPNKAFSAINDADFKFGTVLDGKEGERELSHASFGLYLRDHDRVLRKNAFLQMHGKYIDYENTLSELLTGVVETHIFQAKARKYPSSLDAALYPKNIDTSVYHSLIQAVNEEISALHEYVELRQKLLKVDKLHLYDMHVPLTADIEIKIPYSEAEDLVIASVAPLGKDYQDLLRNGFKNQRWVDRYENKNKRSGAYSSGCYDSVPYILMNYKDILRDVFTLAHEAGHSMHSLLTHKHQPYQYGDYPIFLAEVASTFNEALLSKLLLEKATSREEKIYLLNQKIEDIRSTLFRQTMFAEFELFIHKQTEQGTPLTPKFLREEYRKLNEKYFGVDVVIDKEAEIEWARIPHFYYNFYVYQYATGISAAIALAQRVTKGGEKEKDDYLSFLKSGCSRYPIETLKLAGVDMTTPEPVKSAIQYFRDLVAQLKNLLEEKS